VNPLTTLNLAGLPSWAAPTAGVAVLTVLAAAGYAAGRRRTTHATAPTEDTANARGGSGPVEMALTLAAAGIATGVAVNGMWRVFGDALGFTGPGRVALAGFLEIALMVSAIRARRSLRETGSVGVDGAAVWAMAALSAVLAAADAHGLARAVRFAAPLVAAWLWERGMAADRRATRPTTAREAIAWRWTRARLAVWLGLAEPTRRGVSEVDRARRLARLTRARLRLAVLETTTLPRPLAWATFRPVRAAWAGWRLQRHALTAVEHLRLGDDPTITVTIRSTVATVVGLRAATTATALAHVDPWTTRPQLLTGQHAGQIGTEDASAPAGPDASALVSRRALPATHDASGRATGQASDRDPGDASAVAAPDGTDPIGLGSGIRCEACGSRPAVGEWARPQAGAPFRLCAVCAPVAEPAPVAGPAPVRARRPRTAAGVSRTSGAGGKGGKDTAAAVARLRAQHPDWTPRQIAARLGVTDRTVRRYLNPTTGPAGDADASRAA
jgi:Homeodomain-like domain